MGLIDPSRIGSSDVPAILGLHHHRTPLDVWLRIVHGIDPSPTGYLAERVALGHALEEGIARAGAQAVAHRALGPGIKLGECPTGRPWQRLHPSDFAFPREDGPPIYVEAKSRTWGSYEAEAWTAEEPGPAITAQIVTQLEGSSTPAAAPYFEALGIEPPSSITAAALVGGYLRTWTVHRDPEAEGLILEACERFWVDHVKRGIPPDVERPTEAARAWVASAYGGAHTGLRRPADDAEIELWARLTEARTAVREWSELRDALTLRLQSRIGHDLGIVLPDGSELHNEPKIGRVNPWTIIETLKERGLDLTELEEASKPRTRELRIRKGKRRR